MIQALLASEKDPAQMADLARQSLRGKIPELQKAPEGHRTEHHRFLRWLLWKELTQQEALIAELDAKIEELTRGFAPEIEPLDAVPGVGRRVAEGRWRNWERNIGPFSTHRHLSAWARMCPGNEESVGKRRKRRITQGNRWLKRTLVQAAWAATHKRTATCPRNTDAWKDAAARNALSSPSAIPSW
jgi:transposase